MARWCLTPSWALRGGLPSNPARPVAHPQCVVPVPALRRILGLRWQHRPQPAFAGRRGGAHGHAGQRWRVLPAAPAGAGHHHRCVGQVQDTYTAQAMIMTDRDNNPDHGLPPWRHDAGPHTNQASTERAEGIRLGIIAPDGRDAMLSTRAMPGAGHSIRVRSGQGLPMFSGDELLRLCGAGHLGHCQRLRGQDAVSAPAGSGRLSRRCRAGL